jgi:hypothetical protein
VVETAELLAEAKRRLVSGRVRNPLVRQGSVEPVRQPEIPRRRWRREDDELF